MQPCISSASGSLDWCHGNSWLWQHYSCKQLSLKNFKKNSRTLYQTYDTMTFVTKVTNLSHVHMFWSCKVRITQILMMHQDLVSITITFWMSLSRMSWSWDSMRWDLKNIKEILLSQWQFWYILLLYDKNCQKWPLQHGSDHLVGLSWVKVYNWPSIISLQISKQ